MSVKDLQLHKKIKDKHPVPGNTKKVSPAAPAQARSGEQGSYEMSFVTLGILKSKAEGVVHVIGLYVKKDGLWRSLGEMRLLALSPTTLGMISPIVMHTALVSVSHVPPILKVDSWIAVDTIDFFNQVVAPLGSDFVDSVITYTNEHTIFGRAYIAKNDMGAPLAVSLKSCLINKNSSIYTNDGQLGDVCCISAATVQEGSEIIARMELPDQAPEHRREITWVPGAQPPPVASVIVPPFVPIGGGTEREDAPTMWYPVVRPTHTFASYVPAFQTEIGFYRMDCVQSLQYIDMNKELMHVSKYLLPAISGTSVRQLHEMLVCMAHANGLTTDDIMRYIGFFDSIGVFYAHEWKKIERRPTVTKVLEELGSLHPFIAVTMATKAADRICKARRAMGFEYARIGMKSLLAASGGQWHATDIGTAPGSGDIRELLNIILDGDRIVQMPSRQKQRLLCYVGTNTRSKMTALDSEMPVTVVDIPVEEELRHSDGRLIEEWGRFNTNLEPTQSVLIVHSSIAFSPPKRVASLRLGPNSVVLRRNELPLPNTVAYNELGENFCNVFIADGHMYSTDEWVDLMASISAIHQEYKNQVTRMDPSVDVSSMQCRRTVLGCPSLQPCLNTAPAIRELSHLGVTDIPELSKVSATLFSWMKEEGGFESNHRIIVEIEDEPHPLQTAAQTIGPSHKTIEGNLSVALLFSMARKNGPAPVGTVTAVKYDKANALCRDEWNTLIWLMATHFLEMKLIIPAPDDYKTTGMKEIDVLYSYMETAYATEYWTSYD